MHAFVNKDSLTRWSKPSHFFCEGNKRSGLPKQHAVQRGDVSVHKLPHYDINRCTFPWNFIVITDQEAWTLSTPTAAPTYLEWILRSNSGTSPVQYVLCEPPWPNQRQCARLWKGDWVRGAQGIVFEVFLLSERQKRALLILWDH